MTNLIENFTDEELRAELSRRNTIEQFNRRVYALQLDLLDLMKESKEIGKSFSLRNVDNEVILEHGAENERTRGV